MHKSLLIPALLLTALLAGCADDEPPAADEDPARPPPAEPSWNLTAPAGATALEPAARLAFSDGEAFPRAAGVWAHGDYVFGSALGSGFFVADLSDPAAPVLLWNATTDAGGTDDTEDTITSFARDADVLLQDDRLVLVLATQSDGMHVWDVTEPADPAFLARVFDESVPNHNVAVVPGTDLVFNSQSGGAGRTNDLVDLSDPAHPVVLGAYGTHGCHDITFFGAAGDERFRAYCAGIQRTEIWDLSGLDPDATDFGIHLVATVEAQDSPVVGNPVFGSYPARTLHHLAMVNQDASVLIVGDEHNGGGSPGTCLGYEDTTGLSTPFGALWFYDLGDEAAPRLLSWFSPPAVLPAGVTTEGDPTTLLLRDVPNCTAHFGTLVPGEEKLVMAWYSAGVLLIDFSDPTNPRLLDQFQPADGINTWDARVHGGYVFTGDMVRGMDVLKLV